MSTAVVICTEPGVLEKRSMLLVNSLRQCGGMYKDIPIYSFSPRNHQLSKTTLSFFEKHKVHHKTLSLNQNYPEYALANKIYTCAYFEANSKFDAIVFLDSDQVFFQEPKAFELLENEHLKLSYVAMKGIGSNGNDKNSGYWKKLYQILEVEFPSTIKVCDEKIFPYYNSGIIISRRSNGLFSKWKTNFEVLKSAGISPASDPFFLEQSCFSATVSQMKLNVTLLPRSYNYHLLEHPDYQNSNKENFDSLTSIHYHNSFNSLEDLSNSSHKHLFNGSRWSWLKDQFEALSFFDDFSKYKIR